MKNIMRKIFTLLVCAFAIGAWADVVVVSTEADLRAALEADYALFQLGADIDLSNSTLSIRENSEMVIDLNGHKLDRKLTQRGEGGGQVITVRKGAKLSLSNGTLAGGWGGNAGGLSNEGGTVTLYHVTITGCTGDDAGGGIINFEGGTLTMTGGAITNNKCIDKGDLTGGAGIFNAEGATATLTGVTISGNQETVYGGAGICNYGEITLDGCTITGNKAISTGGGIWNKGALNMKGANNITGNVNSKGQTDNLHIQGDTAINVIGSLEGSQIGIAHDMPRVLTRGYNKYNYVLPSTYFVPDVEGMRIVMEDEEAKLTTADEDVIYYNERSWDNSKGCVKTEVKTLAKDHYTVLEGIPQGDLKPEQITHWKSGNYVCQGNVTLGNVEIDADQIVHLILCNGSHLNIDNVYAIGEINLRSNATLYIHDQPNLGNNGLLTPNSILGKDTESHIIRVIIHGGKITIDAHNQQPAIGQFYGHESSRYVIYDGTLKLSALSGCPAIGSTGLSSGNAGIIEIYGGTIDASSGREDPGWGYYYSAAAIGGGGKCSGATIYIHGGTITANGGHEAAGIGCGQEAESGKDFYVNISGGTVKAYGDNYGAGIGGGDGVRGGTVKISGGHVEAYGGTDAAGIGGGEGGKGGTVEISGGYVYAKGNDNGAGIGGGEDADGGSVTITGGTVIAKTTGEDEGSRAIGPGDGSDNYGSLDISGDLMVSSERKASEGERKAFCWYRTNVKIEPCDHKDVTYTVDGTTATDHHIAHCPYCGHSHSELHHFDGHGKCTVCGCEGETKTVILWVPKAKDDGSFDGQTYAPASSHAVVPNTAYVLQQATVNVPGYKFLGWEATNEPTGTPYISPYTKAVETLYPAGSSYTVTDVISFVARYQIANLNLHDDESNGETLALYDGRKVTSVTLSGRTLTKDNIWQTLCLPFALSTEELAASPLAGATIKQLDLEGEYEGHKTGYDLASNTLYLYFKDAAAIEAGKPYVIRWASGDNIIDPVFKEVTITNQRADEQAPYSNFIGLYAPKKFTTEEPTIVYLGANNAFLQPDGLKPVAINAFRGYFCIHKLYVMQAAATPVTVITNLDEVIGLNGIGQITNDQSPMTNKYLFNGMLFIERNGKIYNANGTQIR
jgi:hypothetical protein